MLSVLIKYLIAKLETFEYLDKVHGLSTIVQVGDETMPAVYSGNELVHVNFDSYDSLVYIQQNGKVGRETTEHPAIACKYNVVERYPLRLIVYSQGKENVNCESYSQQIADGIKAALNGKQQILETAANLTNATIILGDTDLDKNSVWQSQFSAPNQLRDSDILISIDLEFEIEGDDTCFANNPCENSEFVFDLGTQTFCERVDDCLDIPSANGNYVLKILNGVKSWVSESTGGGVWGSIIGTITNQTDLVNYITTRLTGYATEAFVTSQGYITNVITSLGYTPENVANKSDSFTVSSSTTYSSTKALVDGLATKQNSLGYTAENTANKSDSFTASSSTTYASTKALVDGLATRSLVLLSTATASNSSSIDFEVDYTVYKKYIIEFTDVQSSVNYTDDLWLRVGKGSPVAYQSGASDYSWVRQNASIVSSGTAATTTSGNYSDTKVLIAPFLNNTGVYSVDGRIEIFNPSGATFHKNIMWHSTIRLITAASIIGTYYHPGSATYRAATAITGLRIMSSTGNILTGTFKLYGVA